MKMNKWPGLMLAILVFASSCTDNKDYTVTSTGLGYKIFPGSGKDSVKQGSYIRFRILQKIEDSSLFIPDETPDQFDKVDTNRTFDIWEIANKLKVGDSIVYRFPVDSILAKSNNAPPGSLPPYLKKGTNMYLYVKLLTKYDSVQQVQEAYKEEMTRLQKVLEDKRKKEIETIAKEKFEGAIKTPNGVYIKIKEQGNGPACDTGKIISVKYEGRFTDGRVFDGNINKKDTALEKPTDFMLLPGELIPGWLEAFPLLRKGAKASLLIPYEQAYGQGGDRRAIPGFSNLLFDIEIVDVKDAPAQAPGTPPPAGN